MDGRDSLVMVPYKSVLNAPYKLRLKIEVKKIMVKHNQLILYGYCK